MSGWADIEEMDELRRDIRRLSAEFESIVPRKLDPGGMPRMAEALKGKFERVVVCATLLYYYAPRSLVGEKIPKMTRDMMAKALGCNAGYISRKRNVILFLYRNDKAFREEAESAMRYVETRQMNQ